ncbi:ATP-binding protein [Kitasatospora kifunensis]|uniref:Anti-sigma regulatory factor (Ser/Thr protein kinase) n=1 Tax=Kitasatospora kifunensis TaxID=58351 RepID=A0A7W7R6C1_KITKI|nr:ATP-binding protein [Kitasatospora kifunensis]MBB4926227.1 anti-sigma regulatory factor (Ser/Thr protein kinase) [Kitasatospora kifunensis]
MPETLNQLPIATAMEPTWLARSDHAPARARRLLLEFLSGVRGGERFADKGRLLVSELVTNALVHATRHDQKIRLRLEVDGDQLWITVEDASDQVPQQRKDTDGESGRGLLLVEALSDAWGWGPREGIGKQVWCVCSPDPAVR